MYKDLEKKKEWEETNKNKRRKYHREYKMKHKEKYYAKNKEWREINKEWYKKYQREYDKQYKIDNKDRLKALNRDYRLRRCYGINRGGYDELFNKQEGKCKICNRHQSKIEKEIGVDHDHATGKIRGLLCTSCNLVIGYAKDSINVLENAINYLKQFEVIK